MAPYISQWELIEQKAQEKGIPLEALDQFRGFFSVGASQVYPRASKEAQQYLVELWTWNKFFRSGDVFPGRDPLYDDLVAALNNVDPVAARTKSTSKRSTAWNAETGTSVEQASLETEMILMKAQLNRQQLEVASFKESIQGKDSVIREKDKALKACEKALENNHQELKRKEKLLSDAQKRSRNLSQENKNKGNALCARNEDIRKLCALNDELMAQNSQLHRGKRNLELEDRDEGAKRFKKEVED